AEIAQSLPESIPHRRIIDDADARNPSLLLRARRERPRGSRAAEQRDELAAPHSMTSSASANSRSGTSMPSAFAVLRLITHSNFVDCGPGNRAALPLLRMRPA